MSKFDPNAPVVVDQVAIVRQDTTRAEQVVEEIASLDSKMNASQFKMCFLLAEFDEGQYWHADHCQTRKEFLKKRGIELSDSEVGYRVKIGKYSKQFGITEQQLKAAKISKLKAIFELDPTLEYKDESTGVVSKMADIMVQMVASAPTTPLKDVKAEVKKLKGATEGEDSIITFMKLPVFKSREDFINEGIELAKALSGDSVNPDTKEAEDISTATAIERMVADFMSDPNNQLAEVGTEGDFSDELIHVDEDGNSWETMDV